MIEFIRKGTLYPDRRMSVECPRCLSFLEFKGSDVKEGVTFSYIICPLCSEIEDGWVNVAKAEPYG